MAKKNKQAKKMAAAGKSAAQIKAKTGVGSQTAQGYVAKRAPTPPPSTSTPTPSTPSRSTPEIKGVNQGLRIAGENGISKGNFKDIAKATGKSDEKIVGKLDKINTKLEDKDKAGINLKSGAANMLIKKAQKSSNKSMGYRTPFFGEGAIGSTLQSMISTPARDATWVKGALLGGSEANPGFNPGGSPDKNRMTGGTVIRPSGKIANKGTGQQYELPKRFRDEEEVVEKDPIVKVVSEPDKPDNPDKSDGNTNTVSPVVTEQEPTDPMIGMMAGGGTGAAGANKLGRAKSRLKKLGITGNTANQMGRGNVYRNLINMF